jgi:phage protein D
MTFADLAEKHDEFYAPTFEVRVGNAIQGFPSPDRYTGDEGLVSGLSVETSAGRGRINRFSFELNDVFDRQDGPNGAFDEGVRSAFTGGSDVEIEMGYGDGKTTLLRGRIDSVKPKFPAQGAPSLSVEGYDFLQGLRSGTGSGHWEDTDLKSIVTDLVSDQAFASTEIDTGGVSIGNRQHPETSDYEFLKRLAREHDAEFFSRAGTFHFRRQSLASELSPEAELRYGRALRSFTPGTANPRSGDSDSGSGRVGTVEVRHNDETKGEAIVGTAEVAGGGEQTRVETVPVRSQAEAEQRARSIAGEIERVGDVQSRTSEGPGGDRRAGSRGETLGLPEIQAGRVLDLGGLGSEFSGSYYVESTTHRIDESGYTTAFELRRLSNE